MPFSHPGACRACGACGRLNRSLRRKLLTWRFRSSFFLRSSAHTWRPRFPRQHALNIPLERIHERVHRPRACHAPCLVLGEESLNHNVFFFIKSKFLTTLAQRHGDSILHPSPSQTSPSRTLLTQTSPSRQWQTQDLAPLMLRLSTGLLTPSAAHKRYPRVNTKWTYYGAGTAGIL